MQIVICEKISRITKNRNKLQRELDVQIETKGKEVSISGDAEKEYIAEKVVQALDFGFPFSAALLLKEEDFMMEILNIKSYTKRQDLPSIRARIIGKDGKALKTLSSLTKCNIELKDNQVGLIGEPEYIRYAQEGIVSIIHGAKHSNVYAFLEKHQPQPVIDLGLKEVKKKKKR